MKPVSTRPHFVVCAALLFLTACGNDTSTPQPLNNDPVPDMGTEVDMRDEEDAADPVDMNEEADAGTLMIPDFAFPPIPREVDTQVSSPVRAGDDLVITCRLLDENGSVVEPDETPEFDIAVFPEGSFAVSGDTVTAVRVGTGSVRCAAPELGLVDQTPAEVEILPGPPYTSVITVSTNQAVAGETINATCEFLDEYGNAADPATDMLTPELAISPSGGGIDVVGFDATITVADVYTMSCFVPGLSNEQQAVVEVIPDLPSQIVAAAVPNQPVYGLGQVIQFAYTVSDQYGNVIENAEVSSSVSPSLGANPFGNGRYRFDAEGTFIVTLQVDGPTQGGQAVQTSVAVTINGDGPGINCDNPLDGTMVDMSPGALATFEGSVADANGVDTLLINGSAVTVEADGTFSTLVSTQWGINFVEIVATDQFGEENSRTCSFLVSDYYSSQSTYMDDAVALKLRQPAVDDGSRVGGITSLADLLHTVLNSQGILNEVDNALDQANPLQPFTCESETCIFGLCVCWLGYGVAYDNQLRVQGPRTVDLDLVNGGVRAAARIEDLGIRLDVDYVLAEIPGSTDGWVDVDSVDVTLILDLFLDAGNNPRASIRPNSVQVTVGNIDTDFSGLDGTIINFVISVFNGTVRDLLADTIQGFIEDSFDDVIDGVVSSLDIDTLGSTFAVPQLDGSGTTDVRFNLRFSRMDANTSRLNVGVGTRFTPLVTRNSSPTLGVARRHSAVWSEPSTSDPVAVGVYVGVLNHVLHALWRGGLFDATIDGASLGANGAEATISASLPPVVDNLSNGTVQLGLGGLSVSLIYPGIFDDPLAVSLGAIASSSVTLQGDELSFGAINIDELYFSTPTVSLDASTRAVLEGFLLQIIQDYVDTSLNQSLPALPIPSFQIPSSLSQYGLPANAELGITNATLDTTTRQYILEGTFGVR